jgi:hypothetical protein
MLSFAFIDLGSPRYWRFGFQRHFVGRNERHAPKSNSPF